MENFINIFPRISLRAIQPHNWFQRLADRLRSTARGNEIVSMAMLNSMNIVALISYFSLDFYSSGVSNGIFWICKSNMTQSKISSSSLLKNISSISSSIARSQLQWGMSGKVSSNSNAVTQTIAFAINNVRP